MLINHEPFAQSKAFMRNLFTFFTFLALVGAACDDTNKTPTAANCEPLTTLEACWNAGCDFDTAWRTILYDGHCAAVHEGKFCFVGGESSNNLTMTVCRETAEGTESMTLGSLWDRVEGWQACGEYVDQCGASGPSRSRWGTWKAESAPAGKRRPSLHV